MTQTIDLKQLVSFFEDKDGKLAYLKVRRSAKSIKVRGNGERFTDALSFDFSTKSIFNVKSRGEVGDFGYLANQYKFMKAPFENK